MKPGGETLEGKAAVSSSRERSGMREDYPQGRVPEIIGKKHLLMVFVLGISALTGFLCLIFPARYIVILAVGLLGFGVICMHPIVGLVTFYILTYIRPQEITYGFERFRLSLIVALASFLGWILGEVRSSRRQFQRSKQNYIVLGLWLALIGSTIFSFDARTSFGHLVEWSKIFLLYLVTVNLVRQEKQFRLLIWVLMILTAFLALRADYRYFHLGYTKVSGYGLSWDNNDWGLALVMVCPFFYFLVFEQPTVFRKMFLAGLFLISTLAVVATGSRGAFLGLIATEVFLLIKGKSKLLGISIACLIVIFVFLFASPSYIQEIRSIGQYQDDASAMGRVDAWKIGWQMMKDRPLAGVGLGQFIVQRRNYESTYDRHVAHSAYFQLGAESGVLALILFLLLLSSMIYDLHRLRWQVRRGKAFPWVAHYSLMLEAGLWGYIICSAFLSRERFDVLYLFVALVVVLCHRVGLKPQERQSVGGATLVG